MHANKVTKARQLIYARPTLPRFWDGFFQSELVCARPAASADEKLCWRNQATCEIGSGAWPLERFRFKCCHLKIMRGRIFLRKMPLGIYVSVNSRIETAVASELKARGRQWKEGRQKNSQGRSSLFGLDLFEFEGFLSHSLSLEASCESAPAHRFDLANRICTVFTNNSQRFRFPKVE